MEEVREEVGEEEQQGFDLETPQKHSDSIVSLITQCTPLYIGPPRKTYTDLIVMLQEKERTITELSKQISQDNLITIKFICSQE